MSDSPGHHFFHKAFEALKTPKEPTIMEQFRENLEVSSAVYRSLFDAQDWTGMSNLFLKGWQFLHKTFLVSLPQDILFHLNAFLAEFLYWWSREEFTVPAESAELWLALNTCIGNTVAVSAFKTTDAFVSIIMGQQQNMLRMLVLYNARCEYLIDRAVFFDANPLLASVWWAFFIGSYQGGLVSETVQKNLRLHLEFGERLIELRNFHNVMFGATYIDPTLDRKVKTRANALLQEQVRNMTLDPPYTNRPDPKHIAVISGVWATNHSVWRNQVCFVEALKAAGYRLTLVHCGDERDDLERGLFDDVKRVWVTATPTGGVINFNEIIENDWGMAYFADIGMTLESVFLSNMRLAPVMAASYGHSSSTFGSLVDVFIGSRDIESDIARRTGQAPQDRYSERLVMIPGWGIGNRLQPYTRRGYTPPEEGKPILIACPWYGQKVCVENLMVLKRIGERAEKAGFNVRFRLFSGGALTKDMSFLPFCGDVAKILGDRAEITLPLAYEDYLVALEACAFAVDEVRFGGCNSVADSLYLGQAVVAQPGGFWRNTVGSFLAQATLPTMNCGIEEGVLVQLNLMKQGLSERPNEQYVRHRLCWGDKATGRGFVRAVQKLLEETYSKKETRQAMHV